LPQLSLSGLTCSPGSRSECIRRIGNSNQRVYCRETGYQPTEIDTADPFWIERIEEFFQKKSLTRNSIPDEKLIKQT
jgi:hypothetical protein